VWIKGKVKEVLVVERHVDDEDVFWREKKNAHLHLHQTLERRMNLLHAKPRSPQYTTTTRDSQKANLCDERLARLFPWSDPFLARNSPPMHNRPFGFVSRRPRPSGPYTGKIRLLGDGESLNRFLGRIFGRIRILPITTNLAHNYRAVTKSREPSR
jgi:hypothetical protein